MVQNQINLNTEQNVTHPFGTAVINSKSKETLRVMEVVLSN